MLWIVFILVFLAFAILGLSSAIRIFNENWIGSKKWLADNKTS